MYFLVIKILKEERRILGLVEETDEKSAYARFGLILIDRRIIPSDSSIKIELTCSASDGRQYIFESTQKIIKLPE